MTEYQKIHEKLFAECLEHWRRIQTQQLQEGEMPTATWCALCRQHATVTCVACGETYPENEQPEICPCDLDGEGYDEGYEPGTGEFSEFTSTCGDCPISLDGHDACETEIFHRASEAFWPWRSAPTEEIAAKHASELTLRAGNMVAYLQSLQRRVASGELAPQPEKTDDP